MTEKDIAAFSELFRRPFAPFGLMIKTRAGRMAQPKLLAMRFSFGSTVN